jgi:hypothetical protein
MLIDEFLCKREVLGKSAPHSFTPPLSVVGVSNKSNMSIRRIEFVCGTRMVVRIVLIMCLECLHTW